MEKFLRQLWKFLIPVVTIGSILIALYLYFDPFKVIYKYQSYYASGKVQAVALNNEYVAVETFLSNYPTQHYDSFIFGSSRSRFYQIDTWEKYINSNKCYHFDASAESIFGIAKKFEFLKNRHVKIKNALIVLDGFILFGTKNSDEGHLFIKHPTISGESVKDFHIEFFKAFCSFGFLRAYFDYKISGKIKNYMLTDGMLNREPVTYDYITNETRLQTFDDSIARMPQQYYSKRVGEFYWRDTTVQKYAPPIILQKQQEMLATIRNILTENGTKYKIVISPLYDQSKLCKQDMDYLRNLFGAKNVYDYAGINKFTNDIHNYYESYHYRPIVGNQIIKEIYSK